MNKNQSWIHFQNWVSLVYPRGQPRFG